MRDVNWDEIQEQTGEFERPVPGAYIARIIHAEDVEDKEYLRIEWDFDEGQYKGNNQDTYDRAGFWPAVLIRSYKQKALGFFKGFKTCVEASNPGYVFSTRDIHGLEGKRFGVVIGDEEYRKNNGEIGTRSYVYLVRSVKAIQDGDFKIPELKRLPPPAPASSFASLEDDDDGDLPF